MAFSAVKDIPVIKIPEQASHIIDRRTHELSLQVPRAVIDLCHLLIPNTSPAQIAFPWRLRALSNRGLLLKCQSKSIPEPVIKERHHLSSPLSIEQRNITIVINRHSNRVNLSISRDNVRSATVNVSRLKNHHISYSTASTCKQVSVKKCFDLSYRSCLLDRSIARHLWVLATRSYGKIAGTP